MELHVFLSNSLFNSHLKSCDLSQLEMLKNGLQYYEYQVAAELFNFYFAQMDFAEIDVILLVLGIQIDSGNNL